MALSDLLTLCATVVVAVTFAAVLIFYRISVKPVGRASATKSGGGSGRVLLEESLRQAIAANPFLVDRHYSPLVALDEVSRYSPVDYEASVRDLSEAYRVGRSISVDLRRLDSRNASRLVDFCSGMTAGSAGWIFRIADLVIVVTPPSE